ncbi:hypothetical protein [Pseudomonas sp.]|uniref:hypothetical protein n=1 Tax=Pseudomonas sp. TaxID=306 RepID=UPI00290ED68B|nr:hypothetical protein [Pseudomonas sp.]MDU4254551.1 hypothetical protein [Pseudomonas sp.]
MTEFDGKPLPAELRRLARKSVGDCAAMLVTADALDSGTIPLLKSRSLAGALQSLANRNMGDAKSVMIKAADVLTR